MDRLQLPSIQALATKIAEVICPDHDDNRYLANTCRDVLLAPGFSAYVTAFVLGLAVVLFSSGSIAARNKRKHWEDVSRRVLRERNAKVHKVLEAAESGAEKASVGFHRSNHGHKRATITETARVFCPSRIV